MLFSTIFLLDCGGNARTVWYLFVRVSILTLSTIFLLLWWKCLVFGSVSILTFSTIFLLDCGGNVQTGWYLFASVSILPFSTIFLLDCGAKFQTG